MSDTAWEDRVREAEAESNRRLADGDAVGAAEALGEKASLLAAIRSYDKAALCLGECAALAQSANAPGPRAEYLHAQALLLARMDGREDEAQKTFRTSAALARVAGDAALEVRGLRRIAELTLNKRDIAGAVSHLDMAHDRAVAAGLDEAVVEILRLRAVYLQTQGRFSRAVADLDRAVELAQAAEEPDLHLLMQLRLERRVLSDLTAGRIPGESFEALRRDAEEVGAADVAADVSLQVAGERLRAGDAAAAVAEAESAKRHALESDDVYRYTLACLLLAEAHERLGDLAAVLGVLLGCKLTLESQVSVEAGQAVKGVLQSLEVRWGAETIRNALAEHRRRVAASPTVGHA